MSNTIISVTNKFMYTNTMKNIQFVYFGTPEFSTIVLDELEIRGFVPSLIITAPDRPVGRKHVLTSPPVKIWADAHNIECWQPEHPRDILEKLQNRPEELYIVASYGYILSQKILDIPKRGIINVHTSLLPKYRGASPIEAALLNNDKETGSTIMKMVFKMDQGPIIAQSRFNLDPHITKPELFEKLAHDGGKLLADTLEPWLRGDIEEAPQDASQASTCGKIVKLDGDITHDSDCVRYNKYRAYFGWPGVFMFDDNIRLKITKARFEDEKFIIEKVIPAGKKEIDYSQYLNPRSC